VFALLIFRSNLTDIEHFASNIALSCAYFVCLLRLSCNQCVSSTLCLKTARRLASMKFHICYLF